MEWKEKVKQRKQIPIVTTRILKAIIEEQVTSLQNKNLFFDVNAKKKSPPHHQKKKK